MRVVGVDDVGEVQLVHADVDVGRLHRLDDLVQQGYLGLVDAMDRFELDRERFLDMLRRVEEDVLTEAEALG